MLYYPEPYDLGRNARMDKKKVLRKFALFCVSQALNGREVYNKSDREVYRYCVKSATCRNSLVKKRFSVFVSGLNKKESDIFESLKKLADVGWLNFAIFPQGTLWLHIAIDMKHERQWSTPYMEKHINCEIYSKLAISEKAEEMRRRYYAGDYEY